jgi:protein archease
LTVPYRFLDDAPPADLGFVASGATLDECFQAAADATLDVMLANRDVLRARVRHPLHVDNDRLDMALLSFLEQLVYYKDANAEFLRAAQVAVTQRNGRWVVEAVLEGEPIDASRHQMAGDVKAVTLHRLKVERTPSGWEATVVLDV